MTELDAKLQEAAELAINFGIDLPDFRRAATAALVEQALKRTRPYKGRTDQAGNQCEAARLIRVHRNSIARNCTKKAR